MGIDMYLDEVRTQSQQIQQKCRTYISAAGKIKDSVNVFLEDSSLQGAAYASARAYFAQVYLPLSEAIVNTCETLIKNHQQFPDQYVSEVDANSLQEERLLEQIHKVTRLKGSFELLDAAPSAHSVYYQAMITSLDTTRQKLQEKLDRLYAFHQSSPAIFSESESMLADLQQTVTLLSTTSTWDAATGTFTADTALTASIDDLNRRLYGGLAAGYTIKKPEEMSDAQYAVYQARVRGQIVDLYMDGWDDKAIKAYLKTLDGTINAGNYQDVLNRNSEEFKLVGSDVYKVLYDKTGLSDKNKLRLFMRQMGGEVDDYGMLQLKGTHTFNPDMPPHDDFLAMLRKDVQTAYPTEKGLKTDALGHKYHLFRSYIDLQSIEYVRTHYEGATDYEKLKAYAEEYDLKFDYSTGARAHNRPYEGNFDYPDNMKVQVPKENTLGDKSKLNNARMSEFIVDMETGRFISEWNVYQKLPDGTYDSNPANYNFSECGDIANTESFNYGPSKGQNKALPAELKQSHDRLDFKHPDDPDLRTQVTDQWKTEKEFNNKKSPGDYADIVKAGDKDVKAWSKVPEEDRKKVYSDFVKHCKRRNDNDGFEAYCKRQKLYGYK